MNPQPQTRLAPHGDCLRACFASLLEIPIKNIPDFTNLENPHEDTTLNGFIYPAYYALLQSFLQTMNLSFIEIKMDGHPWHPLPYDTSAIFLGTLSSGTKHAVVGRLVHNQFHMTFDPRCMDDDGSVSPFPRGIEAIGLLVSTDPYIPRRIGRALERIIELTKGLVGTIPVNIRHEALEGLYGAGAAQIDDEQDAAAGVGILGPDGRSLRHNGQ